jgi:hypothetical protein
LILKNAHGFKNCNFVNNSIIASYESGGLNLICEKSPDLTLCEMFKEKPSLDQRCIYYKNDSFFKGQCHRLRHTGNATSCEYVLTNIRQNGNTFMLGVVADLYLYLVHVDFHFTKRLCYKPIINT